VYRGPPKASKRRDGPVQASGDPGRSGAPTAAAGRQHGCAPIMVMGEAYREKAGPLAKPRVPDGGDARIAPIIIGILIGLDVCIWDAATDGGGGICV